MSDESPDPKPDYPSAAAASVLLDLLGADTFAKEAVKLVVAELDAAGVGPLTSDHRALIQLGAVKAAMLVADEVRQFAQRP
jgi:hypothetical protein